ncbi:hypothetical protein GCM10027049_22790 [Mucilaginibacter puniceus]
MKPYILLMLFVALFKAGFAQEKLPVKRSFKGQSAPSVELNITGSSISIEGYDGDELTIDSLATRPLIPEPQEARGLANISSIAKYALNRSYSYATPAQPADPKQVFIWLREDNKALLIKVPRNIHLKLAAGFIQTEISKITLKNLTGELEIGGHALVTELNNVTGPVTITSNTRVGSKIIITNMKWPNATVNAKLLLNITTQTADIDISIPEKAKASVDINTKKGEVYSNLNMVSKKSPLSNFSGSLNGGGPAITINTNYGNVFLRKQK